MLIIHPQSVTFGDARWENIQLIAIERSADRLILDRGDDGSQAIFADVPEEQVSIRIVQQLAEEDLDPPRCGAQADLVFHTSASASAGRRLRISTTAVVRRLAYELSNTRGVLRTISLIALSPDGHSDPIARAAVDAEI